MFNQKIEILTLWIIIKILLCDQIKAFDINQLNQTQKGKALDENINIKNPINNNKIRELQSPNYQPIRIYLDTYRFNTSIGALDFTQAEIDLMHTALNKAKDTLEKLIKVQRESNVINAQEYKKLIEDLF